MPQSTISVLLNEPVGTIDPNIYGHFMEHLGNCIAGGCWVGDQETVAHTGGIRNDVVTALKAVGAPVIRWPGGCFADDYHWRDGVGPPASRPRRINIHWGDVIETNEFGTHEFITFCRAVGAQPYFCGNLGSGSPQEMRDWVEYCNFPGDSTLSLQRKANGAPEPLNVRYWGVGNENWGCGGNFTPEDYATEYRRFATYLRNWGSAPLSLIGCGPNENDLDWTRRFFTKLRKDYQSGPAIHGYAAHLYTWNHGEFGSATEYDEAQWHGLLWTSIQMEPLVVQQRALMDAFDPERKIGLIVDEWGTWHPSTPGHNPAFLWQQNTVRDALVAALTLDIFNRHADKVVMANIAQTINVLQSLILTDGDRMVKTPTYHIYDLYRPHQGAQSVRTLIDTPEIACTIRGKTQQLPQLSGSASVTGDTLTLTVVNTSATQTIEARLRLFGGASPVGAHVAGLSYPEGEIRAHNDYDTPDTVVLQDEAAPASLLSQDPTVMLPPASVRRIAFKLA